MYLCKCGNEKIETIPKFDHSYVLSKTVGSTETVAGYDLYVCSACSDSYKEKLPLLIPAYKTEKCSQSLLGKALPNTEFYDFMVCVMKRYEDQLSKDESLAEGMMDLPSYDSLNDFIDEFNSVYSCISRTLPYSFLIDKNNKTAQFICWSSEDKSQILEDCYTRVYEILDELGIDSSTTKWDAIYRINDYLCENKTYQSNGAYHETAEYCYSSIYYSIFSSQASCHNYAISFAMLCLGAGIECHYYPSQTMNHAWNIVFFDDGSSFWVDTCWNDAQYMFPNGTIVETSVENGVPAAKVKKFRETYLLITTEELLKDHTL